MNTVSQASDVPTPVVFKQQNHFVIFIQQSMAIYREDYQQPASWNDAQSRRIFNFLIATDLAISK
jgi:hypothetical protein